MGETEFWRQSRNGKLNNKSAKYLGLVCLEILVVLDHLVPILGLGDLEHGHTGNIRHNCGIGFDFLKYRLCV